MSRLERGCASSICLENSSVRNVCPPPPTLTTFLTFKDQAEQAAAFYCDIFPNSKITQTTRYPASMPDRAGQVMTVTFELDGRKLVALNGGPQFSFSHGVSLMVECDTQDEIDHYWSRLSDGGQPIACGWLTDKYGLAWQITPRRLLELISDPATADAAMTSMQTMVKLDLPTIKKACGL